MRKNNELKFKTRIPETSECFFGREKMLEKIHDTFLQDNQIIFLQGIGGIGKSELAKRYARKYKDYYKDILFLQCKSDLRELIINDEEFSISGIKRKTLENDALEDADDYLERKLKALKEFADSDTLIIVDNFNYRNDVYLNDFLAGKYKVLFTTRSDFSNWKYPIILVNEIDDIEEVKKIFYTYYRKDKSEENDQYIENIIRHVQSHTLMVEWLAKQLADGASSPKSMYESLKEKGLVYQDKDAINNPNISHNHKIISRIFNFNELTNEEKNVLMYMTFVPYTGISKQDLILRGERGCHSALLKLMRNSWIRVDNENGNISLHPVIAELAFSELQPNWKKVFYFINRIKEDLENTEVSDEIVQPIIPIAVNLLEKLPMDCVLAVEFALSVAHALQFRKIDFALAEKYVKRAIELQKKLKVEIREKLSNFENEDIFDIEYNLLKSEIYNADVRVCNGLNRLGCIYFDQGEYERALEEFHKLSEYNNIIDPYGNIATTYQNMGELEYALEYAEKSLEYRKRKYGINSYHLYSNYKQIGLIFRDIGDTEKAINYLDLAGDILEAELSDDNNYIFYAQFLMQYASVLRQMQRSKEALKFDIKALEITKNILGKDNMEIAKCYAAIAIDFYRIEDFLHTLEYTLYEIKIRKKHNRIKMRLYMSISRLLPLIGDDLEKYPKLLEKVNEVTSEFNDLLKEYPQEGQEIMQQ